MNNSNNRAAEVCIETLDSVLVLCLPIINSILAVTATAENILVLVAIYKFSALQTTSSQFLCSLAVADLMVGMIMNPTIIVRISMNIYGNVHPLAVFAECLCVQTIAATMFSLLAISIDRYIAVTKVFRYKELVTKQKCTWVILLCWLATLLLPAVRLTITNVAYLPLLWLAAIILTFCLPMMIISFCYFHIWKVAKSQTRKIISQTVVERGHTAAIMRNAKAAWTVGIVITVCILFWTPTVTIGVIQNTTTNDCSKRKMNATWLWGITVPFALSSVNPVIYCFRTNGFKSALYKLLSFRRSEEIKYTSPCSRIVNVRIKQENGWM